MELTVSPLFRVFLGFPDLIFTGERGEEMARDLAAGILAPSKTAREDLSGESLRRKALPTASAAVLCFETSLGSGGLEDGG